MSDIEKCLNDIHLWMTANKLKLNKDKTELIYFYSKYSRSQKSFISLHFGDDLIQPSLHVRDIGAILDCTLSMIPQVNSVCKSAFYQLRNIARIRKYLSPKTTELLVHAFVSSKLDFCNSLLYGIPKHLLRKLQSVQNAAACLVTSSSKFDQVTPLLMQLHWLPIAERIKVKIVLLIFKGLHDLSPSHIKELLTSYCPARMLRSSSTILLARSDYNMKTYGARAFAIFAPELWNQLPDDIRSIDNLPDNLRHIFLISLSRINFHFMNRMLNYNREIGNCFFDN